MDQEINVNHFRNTSSSVILNSENDALLRKLIKEEITAFDEEIRMALNRSKNVQIAICSKDELSKLIRSIDEMQEITTQATESTESIKADVQSLRLTLYEMLAMLAEAQSKVEEFKKVGLVSNRPHGDEFHFFFKILNWIFFNVVEIFIFQQ